MRTPQVTVIIPTLAADGALTACLLSLEQQTFADFDVVIVDNSGRQLVRNNFGAVGATMIENPANVGFGAAINQGIRQTNSNYVATLNDDTVAHSDWLKSLVGAMESSETVGMCASQVRLAGEALLDSAGMLIGRDGSSKQRGHLQPSSAFDRAEEVLFPSGSAALYRRKMLDEIGLFDESFFLYCEDTDLGLRARWAGWECVYAPGAVVEHRYSHSAGRASPLKAYYVERNRLFLLVKNFPLRLLPAASLAALARYYWHAALMLRGKGTAGRFREEGHGAVKLPLFVLRAHLALLRAWPRLLRDRRKIRRTRKLTSRQFTGLLRSHAISSRQIAAL